VRSTGFTDLVGCRLALQQAPLGGLGAGLAGAVAAAGGLGMVAATGMSPEVLERVLDPLSLPLERVGVNFLVPFLERDAVRVAAERARLVDFFWGEPDAALVEEVHAFGALACWQVGSAAEAGAAVEAGCDVVAAQGVEAGGHVRGDVGVLPLLAEVLEAVAVPVIAAGGIASAPAVAAALAAGAAAVRVGTRFVAATEARAHPRYVDRLIHSRADDTVVTDRFGRDWRLHGRHRVIRSALDAAEAFEGDVVGERSGWPVPRFSATPPDVDTTGAIEAMALYAGQSVGAVRRRQAAAEIVRELFARA